METVVAIGLWGVLDLTGEMEPSMQQGDQGVSPDKILTMNRLTRDQREDTIKAQLGEPKS